MAANFDLPDAVAATRGQPSSVRMGVVLSVNPLSVDLQGTVVPAQHLGVQSSYFPRIGDTVALLGQSSVSQDASSWLILDKVNAGPVAPAGPQLQAGVILVSFTALASFTVAITFPVSFAATPAVSTNIASGAGVTSNWQSRAISVFQNGFTLFVFTAGAAQTWVNQPVQWQAQRMT